jgi:Cu/Ag efflux protein CusF
MHKMFAAATAVAMFAFAGAALAEEATGTVGSVDPAAGIIILEDGTTYTVAEGVSVEGLQPGDTVTVSFEVQGDKNMATDVAKAE